MSDATLDAVNWPGLVVWLVVWGLVTWGLFKSTVYFARKDEKDAKRRRKSSGETR